jgi:formylmethanofuran dehydrogenase subunit C
VSGGLVAQLKSALTERADLGEIFAQPWATLAAREIAERPVYLERAGRVPLGELFDIKGAPEGRIRFVGDLQKADRVAAGLSEGEVVVEGSVGQEAGLALGGGSLDIHGNAGPRAGAAPLGYKRGMTAGELIVRGSAGPEAGSAMRRGLLVIVKSAGERTGLGMIAGTVVVFGQAGRETGLWSKRGSVVALGQITPPATYSYACTYQPIVLRLMLSRLSARYKLSVQRKHLIGFYRRYSGDMAELGKGEILEWVAK